MPLPDCFCWTRFGMEAGQPVHHILARKERERVANRGIFAWGVGNAVGPSIRELVRRKKNPEVLFSPIKSEPKPQDVFPSAVAAWLSGKGLDGSPFLLPEHSIVTSRFDPDAPRDHHYALVCFSGRPLVGSGSPDKIDFGEITNLLSGRRIGASQVTAVVQQGITPKSGDAPGYDVAFRAQLAYPYFVRLHDPVVLPDGARVTGDSRVDEAFRLLRERAARGRIPQQLALL